MLKDWWVCSSKKNWWVTREREKEWESNQTFSHYLTVEASERRLFVYTKRGTHRVTETEKKKMSSASLCSSVQSQINGFGGGLKLQKQSLSQPSSLTFTRYGFTLTWYAFSSWDFYWVLLFSWVLEGKIENLCFWMRPCSEMT